MPAQWHDLKLYFGELRVQASYGITRWLSADLQWSLRLVGVQFQLQDLATRRPIAPPFGEELHHRREVVVGPSDPWLGLRLADALGPLSFSFRLGATLPVGSTVENPFARGRAGRVHQHIQLGTGTVDPFFDLSLRRTIGHFAIEGWLLGKTSLYRNPHDYQAGSQLLSGLRASSDLWLSRWRFLLGLLAYREEPERWSGIVENEGNLGRTDLIAESSLSWRFAGRWVATASLRIPVATWAEGAQLTTPAIAELKIGAAFDLLGR